MSIFANNTIETPRILLRRYQESDLQNLVELNSDPRVMKYFPSPLSPQQSYDLIERMQSHYHEWGFGVWVAIYKETQEFVGIIGLNKANLDADFMPCVEILWRLLPQFWNQGLATEAANATLEYGFNHLDLSIINSWTPISNKPSERVMQKIGMTYQGTFMHPKLSVDDALCEHVLYKLTQREYLALSGFDQ